VYGFVPKNNNVIDWLPDLVKFYYDGI